jgi:phage terminase large subunit
MLTKSSNQRVPGWMQVHERLKVIDDVDGGKTARLRIFSTCRNLIRCISTIKADERDCNDVATEPHELTHLPDALRYWCVMHTLSAKEPDTRSAEEKMLADYKASRFRNGGRTTVIRR